MQAPAEPVLTSKAIFRTSVPALFYFTYSCILIHCKIGCKLTVLGKVSPLKPPAISLFCHYLLFNIQLIQELSSRTMNTKQNHDLSEVLPTLHHTAVRYTAIQIVLFFPMSTIFLNCKWNTVKRQVSRVCLLSG